MNKALSCDKAPSLPYLCFIARETDTEEWTERNRVGRGWGGSWSQRDLGLHHCSASVEIREFGQVTKLKLVGSQFALLRNGLFSSHMGVNEKERGETSV